MEQHTNASRLETTDSGCGEARRNHKDTIVLYKCFVSADFGTGLFDSTGKEIFEGDYVQGIFGPPVPVFYHKGTFYVGQFRPLNIFVKDGFVAKDLKVLQLDRIKGDDI